MNEYTKTTVSSDERANDAGGLLKRSLLVREFLAEWEEIMHHK
jgi:hypothetical protein